MSVVKRGAIYHYDFQYRHKRYQGSTNCKSKADAFLVERKVREALKAGQRQTSPEDQTLANAVLGYFKGRNKQKSLKSSRRYALVFCDLLGEHCLLLKLSHTDVLDLREKVAALRVESRVQGCKAIGRGDVLTSVDSSANQCNSSLPRLSVPTVNRYMQFLRRLMRWAAADWSEKPPSINWARQIHDPLSRPAILSPEIPRTRVLKDDEAIKFKKAVKEIRPELLGFFAFKAETGLRDETVASLTWQQIDWKRKTVTVTLGKVAADKSQHTISLSPRALEILEQERGHGLPNVFTIISRKSGHRGQRIPVTCGNFRADLKKILAKAGIQDFRNHDFRHTAATRLVEAGGQLWDVKDLLGVRNDKTAMRYINLPQRLRQLQAKMKPLL